MQRIPQAGHPEMSLRILHVLDHSLPLHSGYTFRTRAIVQAQQARGWTPYLLSGPKQGETEQNEEQVEGLLFHRTPPWKGVWQSHDVLSQLAVIFALSARIKQVAPMLRPDIIHAHSPALDGWAAVQAGKALGLPVVYEVRAFWEDAAVSHGTTHAHSLRYKLTRELESAVLRRAQGVSTICEGLKQDILSRGIDADKVQVIPNAVDIEHFAQLPEKATPNSYTRWGVNEGVVIGFIGSFYAYEGLDLLLRAMHQLKQQGGRVNLLLVGGGPEEERLKQLCQTLELSERVHFTGRIPHQEVNDAYAACDWMVYPRLPERITETVTPLKPLEAMALGRPVLASDVGGHRELIQHGETGLLFTAGDEGALAHTLGNLTRAESGRRMMIEQGRAFVTRERTWKRSVAGYASLYQHALAQVGRGG
uniref:Putative GT4: distantly related to UDP-Glc: 1, 2-diacylglycerol 3-a-glucosyltransferase n=1 Tax=Magnetococcus massalia (strain MO-1) TaxID=451514 RepID=A0A1S7LPS9_MAGMO|nr:putative GT4 : distantly related to UDP-Glc: 1, 2-diacylglycerol 3-a-glucosyltransferase [Candidatus Magnetococcus massalia]